MSVAVVPARLPLTCFHVVSGRLHELFLKYSYFKCPVRSERLGVRAKGEGGVGVMAHF